MLSKVTLTVFVSEKSFWALWAETLSISGSNGCISVVAISSVYKVKLVKSSRIYSTFILRLLSFAFIFEVNVILTST